jgi:hypothetical protein
VQRVREVIDPGEVQIDHILRFEGQSDPGDMTLCSPCARRRDRRASTRRLQRPDAEDAYVIARMQHRSADGTLDD